MEPVNVAAMSLDGYRIADAMCAALTTVGVKNMAVKNRTNVVAAAEKAFKGKFGETRTLAIGWTAFEALPVEIRQFMRGRGEDKSDILHAEGSDVAAVAENAGRLGIAICKRKGKDHQKFIALYNDIYEMLK